MNNNANTRIPMWVNVFQVILILIMLQQVYVFYFDHSSVAASGITIDGSSANKNLLYEFGSRTAVMAIVSIIVLITQKPRYLLVILLMNIFRDGQEMFIDPLFPLLNAPIPPAADFVVHFIIVAIEIWAFFTVFRIVGNMDKASMIH